MPHRIWMSALVAATLLFAPAVQAAEDVDGLKHKATAGDGKAQDALGRYFYEGAGAPDYAEAYKWTKLAAGKGVAEAETRLGQMLMTGLGAPGQDENGAFQQFLKGAKHGQAEACYQVAVGYVTGRGTKMDERQGFAWATTAAKKGHPRGQYLLGVMYLRGLGVKEDVRQACGWLLKAGEQGVLEALDLLRDLPDQGESDLAEGLYHQAAENGDVKAMATVGLLFSLEQDPQYRPEGVTWLRKAAATGDPAAVIRLGKVLVGDCPHDEGDYHHNHGCITWSAPDAAEGAKMLLAAAEAPGGSAAFLAVSHLYSEGTGVAKDPAEAYRWIKRAIASDRYKYPAMAELVWGLDDRFAGIPAADKVYWAAQAAADSHVESCLRLGQAYERGEGVKADALEAAYWYALAAASHEKDVVGPANAGLKRLVPTLTPAQREALGRRVVAESTPTF